MILLLSPMRRLYTKSGRHGHYQSLNKWANFRDFVTLLYGESNVCCWWYHGRRISRTRFSPKRTQSQFVRRLWAKTTRLCWIAICRATDRGHCLQWLTMSSIASTDKYWLGASQSLFYTCLWCCLRSMKLVCLLKAKIGLKVLFLPLKTLPLCRKSRSLGAIHLNISHLGSKFKSILSAFVHRKGQKSYRSSPGG